MTRFLIVLIVLLISRAAEAQPADDWMRLRQHAQEIGALTIGVTVVPEAAMKPHCDIFIAPFVGAEALAGSTRMKSGTAQKLVLNMISTGVMLRLGRVDGNLMTNVQAWCEKLVDRQIRLVMNLANVDSEAAKRALEENDGDVEAAVKFLGSSEKREATRP